MIVLLLACIIDPGILDCSQEQATENGSEDGQDCVVDDDRLFGLTCTTYEEDGAEYMLAYLDAWCAEVDDSCIDALLDDPDFTSRNYTCVEEARSEQGA